MDVVESRLYYDHAYLTTFESPVVEQFAVGDAIGVVLEQTVFYPTAGGQPHDLGLLEGVPVIDVFEREADQAVVHVVPERLPGPIVRGELDWARRFDFMQQHTGQHILSHAAEALFDADTVGFHLTEDALTIDLNRASLSFEEATALEERANALIFCDWPVVATFFRAQAEVDRLPLRKPPAVSGPIRIVSIGDLDFSPCGGTHCASTGAVGQILIRKIERRGTVSRLEFVCGGRALAQARRANRLISDLAVQFSVGESELNEAVTRVVEEAKSSRRDLRVAEERSLSYEVRELLLGADNVGEIRLVKAVFEGRPPASVKYLALRLMESSRCLALLGLVQDGRAQLTFARSADLSVDVRPLLREACRQVGGSGGGQPNVAQGGGPQADQIESALDAAGRAARTLLAQPS